MCSLLARLAPKSDPVRNSATSYAQLGYLPMRNLATSLCTTPLPLFARTERCPGLNSVRGGSRSFATLLAASSSSQPTQVRFPRASPPHSVDCASRVQGMRVGRAAVLRSRDARPTCCSAGGAWSPIGDVTTTMLWIGGDITVAPLVSRVARPLPRHPLALARPPRCLPCPTLPG